MPMAAHCTQGSSGRRATSVVAKRGMRANGVRLGNGPRDRAHLEEDTFGIVRTPMLELSPA